MKKIFFLLIFIVPFYAYADKPKVLKDFVLPDEVTCELGVSFCFEKKICTTSKSDFNSIRDKCIIAKLEPNANSTLRRAVKNNCSRIACDPGFIDKLKYK